MPQKFISPDFSLQAFHCPRCGVFSKMTWAGLSRNCLIEASSSATPVKNGGRYAASDAVSHLWIAHCTHCKGDSLWLKNRMLDPEAIQFGPQAADDMPSDIKDDFNEARSIAGHSPRGAAALIRLCLQKLCKALGEKGDNINADIAALVARGLDAGIQEALDAVRVIGNNAVHPGTIDLKDDQETVESLMELVNFVVDAMITQPNKRKALYARIPASAQAAIAKRDGKTP